MHNTIIGRKPVIEALRAGTRIEKIVMLPGVQGNIIDEIRKLAREKRVTIGEVRRDEFRQFATDAAAQGVVAMVASKHYVTLKQLLEAPKERNEKGFILVLDEIEDPQNLGALVRTAECAGAHGVVIPKHHAAPVTAAVVKASAGATEHMAMAEVTNIVSALEELKEEGYWIVGLDMQGTKHYTEMDYSTPIAVVVGNEGRGIRRLVKEHCDHLVKIPLFGKVSSLNASVAGALVMFEVARARSGQTALPR